MLAKHLLVDKEDIVQVNWFESDMFLVQALRLVLLIDGRQELLNDYRHGIKESVDIETVKARALEKLQKDLNLFSVKLGQDEEGKLIDVKKDIFRIGDRIIDDLANYYEIAPDIGQAGLSVWQVIDKMERDQILLKDGAQHLREAISIVTELRLATYCHNKGQSENMSTYVPAVKHLSEQQKKLLLEETFYIKDTAILHHFYYIIIRLQFIVNFFYDKEYNILSELLLRQDSLLEESNYTKGMVHARFLKYSKALKYMEKAEKEEPENINLLQDLFFLYTKVGAIGSSLRLSDKLHLLINNTYNRPWNHPNIAVSFNNLGKTYCENGEYEKALQCHEKALEIQHIAFKHNPNHPHIVDTYNNMAIVYRHIGNYDQALHFQNEVLKIQSIVYKDYPNHPHVAIFYYNLGNIYNNKGMYNEALKYYKKAREIQLIAYKNNPNNPEIADSYHCLGIVYSQKGNYDKALQYHEKALYIRQIVYKSYPNFQNIAASYDYLGNAYMGQENYEEAIRYFIEALKLKYKAYKKQPNHPYIAGSYFNLGTAYCNKGDYEQAINYHKLGLDVRRKAYAHNSNHPEIADSYNNLAIVYRDMGEYKKALQCYKKALSIEKIISNNSSFIEQHLKEHNDDDISDHSHPNEIIPDYNISPGSINAPIDHV
ncbi:MAG: hypothetical protein K0Q51_1546 [Rickettsiaceae bacterium]|nr:hypothetical protein [Rickettsiaceae bacterium]